MPQKNNHIYINALFIPFLICSLSLQASSEFTPTLTLKEYLVSSKTSTLDENGQITTISPGFRYTNTQRRSQLALDYAYNIERNNGLTNEDTENQSLSLLYGFTHIPKHWVTQLTGNIQQTSISSDGIQSFDSVLNSGNTRELRTYGVNTTINTEIKQVLNFSTQFLADYADFEDAENTNSYGVNLSLDNQVSQSKLFWNTALNSRHSSSSNNSQELNTFLIGLNYRFNAKYTGYINATAYDTSNSDLNDTNTMVGLNWQPLKSTLVSAGIGSRGDDTSYSLNTKFTKKRLTLSVNYNEDITSARSQTLQQSTDETGVLSTFQSLSITPVLQKRATVNVTRSGIRTDATIGYSSQRRSVNNTASNKDELTDSLSLSLSRRLSTKSSVDAKYQLQNTRTSEENDLTSFQLTYNRTLSKSVNMAAELRNSRQRSDVLANEYEENMVGITITASF